MDKPSRKSTTDLGESAEPLRLVESEEAEGNPAKKETEMREKENKRKEEKQSEVHNRKEKENKYARKKKKEKKRNEQVATERKVSPRGAHSPMKQSSTSADRKDLVKITM